MSKAAERAGAGREQGMKQTERPTRYCVEYIPLAVAATPEYNPDDPDPWYRFDDAKTLREARVIAAQRIAAGVIGARATVHRRYGFTYRPEDDSWEYCMERVGSRG